MLPPTIRYVHIILRNMRSLKLNILNVSKRVINC
nr:MAG TPA: hypothetical protein [Caudoviricetes sp.]